jgi:hypothetical protein
MASPDKILAGFVVRLGVDEDEREYTYTDPETERQFGVRRSETLDENSRPHFRFFLEESTPNGRIVAELNECRDEPAIAEAEARVGPNALMRELRRIGMDTKGLVLVGGGYGVDSIFHASLARCAGAIASALERDERYRHFRQMTEQENIRSARQAKADSLAYRQGVAAATQQAWETETGIFKGCYTMLGTPLSDESKNAILSYLNDPGQETWCDIRGLYIVGHRSLWVAWCDSDPRAPRSGNVGFPSADTLREAIRAAAEDGREAAQEGLLEAEVGETGLVVVRD